MPDEKQVLPIPYARGHKDKGKVKNKNTTWLRFIDLFREPYRTDETFAQYLQLSLPEKLKKKNANGYFFAAHCKNGSRRKDAIQPRRILTIDLDENVRPVLRRIKKGEAEICRYEWVAHTTRSSSKQEPRFRFIIPLSRAILPEEHEPLSRIVSKMIDPTMKAIDPVSHRVAQMMFMPTAARDQHYLFKHHEGEILDPDEVIEAWEAEHGEGALFDYDTLPRNPLKEHSLRDRMQKAGWPLDKPGIVGAWCRFTGDIHTTIADYLTDYYEPTEDPNRYQAIGGSGLAGVVIYEDQWLYSHHTTDPCAGELCNSFDAVRLCLFGDKDRSADAETPVTKMPSYKAMKKWLKDVPGFAGFMNKERFGDVDDAFTDEDVPEDADRGATGAEKPADSDLSYDDADVPDEAETRASARGKPKSGKKAADEKDPHAWVTNLQVGNDGALRPTTHNLFTIMMNDRRIRNRWAFNEMSRLIVRTKPLRLGLPDVDDLPEMDPLDTETGIDEQDARAVQALLSRPPKSEERPRGYGVEYGVTRVHEMIAMIAMNNSYHPVRDKLNALPEWDGEKRVDTLFIDYLGVEDNAYHRAAARVCLLGAVARAMKPGISFDYMPVLSGGQGCRKTSFIQTLAFGRPWKGEKGFYTTLPGDLTRRKEVFEATQGAWFIEAAEMVAFRKGESDTLKKFITETVDKVRPAYARHVVAARRTFVLWGTTNEEKFLRDPTGNRRYLPIRLGPGLNKNHPIATDRLVEERDQIWAEALHYWNSGERTLWLSGEAEEIADAKREEAFEEIPELALAEEIDAYYKTPRPIEEFVGDDTGFTEGQMGVWVAITARQVFEDILGGNGDFHRKANGFIFRALKMTRHFNRRMRLRDENGVRHYYWLPKDESEWPAPDRGTFRIPKWIPVDVDELPETDDDIL